MNVLAFSIQEVCSDASMLDLIQIIGWVLLVFKIAIPLLIVGYGVMDFGKAVVAEKEDEIKKQTKRLVFRVIAGIAIFLLPNIILGIFRMFVDDYKNNEAQFEKCESCFLSPGDKC